MNNTEFQLLVLTVYIIGVSYVFYLMYDSLDQLITIEFENESLEEQLKQQHLDEVLEVSFKLRDRYKPDEFQELLINIRNKSEHQSIYIDWDTNVLTDFGARSHRIIRIPPSQTLDLLQPQVFSITAPGQILEEKLTIENTLKRNIDEVLEITNPIFPPKNLKEAALNDRRFTVRLILQVSEPAQGLRDGRLHALSCEFTVKKTPWKQALAWKPNPSNRKPLFKLKPK